jgi:hypothetical protein
MPTELAAIPRDMDISEHSEIILRKITTTGSAKRIAILYLLSEIGLKIHFKCPTLLKHGVKGWR